MSLAALIALSELATLQRVDPDGNQYYSRTKCGADKGLEQQTRFTIKPTH
jgi:hypothetical protein